MAGGRLINVTKDSETNMFQGGVKKSKSTYRKSNKTLKGRVSNLSKDVRFLKKELGQNEIKNFDYNLTTLTTTGWDYADVYNIFQPAQGDNRSERIGDKAFVKSIDLRYHVAQVDTTDLGLMRVIVFVDIPNNLAVTEILDASILNGTLAAPLASYNRANRKLFKILYDVTHELDGIGDIQNFVRVKIPVNMPVMFDADTTTPGSNALKIVFISNTTKASADLQHLFHSRAWYTD